MTRHKGSDRGGCRGATIIGVDCAAEPGNVGLALGRLRNGELSIEDVVLGSNARLPETTVGKWIEDGGDDPILLAIDAPLGWPAPLVVAISRHQASESIDATGQVLFRRTTDQFIHSRLKKMPLAVAADRIAWTALEALRFLATLRSGRDIPVLWSPEFTGAGVIEVYPAATLKGHGVDLPRRKPDPVGWAKAYEEELRSRATFANGIEPLRSPHVLDAVTCLLAGKDFLCGDAMMPEPTHGGIARREGWIWARQPVDGAMTLA